MNCYGPKSERRYNRLKRQILNLVSYIHNFNEAKILFLDTAQKRDTERTFSSINKFQDILCVYILITWRFYLYKYYKKKFVNKNPISYLNLLKWHLYSDIMNVYKACEGTFFRK